MTSINGESYGRMKKTIYLLASVALGVLLSLIVHALLEISYLRLAEEQGLVVPFYGGCSLKPAVQIVFLAVGSLGGFLLGRSWWRIVYIEHRHWRNKK